MCKSRNLASLVVLGVVWAVALRSAAGTDKGATTKPVPPTATGQEALEFTGSLLVQIRVADLDRTIAFYRDVLGFDLFHRNDSLSWAKVRVPNSAVVIGLGAGSEVKGSGSLSLNFGVRDIDRARSRLERRGVEFKGDTITIPGVVKLADFDDPDGNRIRLAQSLDPAVD